MNIRMSTKGKRPLRSLTPIDKIHAIQRIHDGESKASVARDIGVPESTLRGWCKNEDKLRFMSRQSTADKLTAESLTDKLDGAGGLLGPPEKRQRMDIPLPINFSNKMKFDELAYKRSPLNGLDYGANKALTDLNFNGIATEYATFNGSVKSKIFGADSSRQNDPSIGAISPLSSLTHLSGLSGLTQSPLAVSFNELTTNLNLLAQLNPGLAAMSGLNSLAATANSLRNIKPKSQQHLQSPQSDGVERQQGLSVKNWAKQKPPTSTSSDTSFGLNLSQSELKPNIKSPSPTLAPSITGSAPPLSNLNDDPLLYWLKTQQTVLGLNSLYPPTAAMVANSPPIRSSTPQHSIYLANTPPIPSAPLTPSSTPSGSLDDKNTAWFNWCKAFGASLHSLGPSAAAVASLQANAINQPADSVTTESTSLTEMAKPPYENILYSQLTKDSESLSVHSSSSNENNANNDFSNNMDSTKPEDLTAKMENQSERPPSPIQCSTQCSSSSTSAMSPDHSPDEKSEEYMLPSVLNQSMDSLAECKEVLDNLIYKINNNINSSIDNATTPISVEVGSESDTSDNIESLHNNNDDSANNNNNSNKTDEEERAKCTNYVEDDDIAAIMHGEKFLQWLENCSNPRITSVQLMQLRFLIAAIKSGNEANPSILSDPEDISHEESSRSKVRRRK